MEAYRSFEEILADVKGSPKKRVVAVAAADDADVISAVVEAKKEAITDALLIGAAEKIREILRMQDLSPNDFNIVDAAHEDTAQIAVEMVQNGDATFLMKGMLETAEILRPVVSKKNQLRTGRVMSHFSLNHLPTYHKLICNTDGGMIPYPTLEEKKSIVENAVITLRSIGYDMPKVAVLACIEKVNPQMPETVDAAALREMNQRGEIAGCIVEGPLSYDIAMSAEIARHKHFDSPHAGNFDVLLVPTIATGNVLGKSWTVTANARMAGIIVGAAVPVVLTSRASSPEEKLNSIALAARASMR